MSTKSVDPGPSTVALLARGLHRIRSTPPRIIASPATQPRRAAVALIIRVVPSPSSRPPSDPPRGLSEFFEQDWVKDPYARAEILFLRRDKPSGPASAADERRPSSAGEAHVAFPGGRTEEGDEGGLYTAMRQTWEEIGIDLAEKDYECIGQLDDREITTSLGKRLLMVLSPFVFLQLTPHAPPPEPVPSTSLHWVPLSALLGDIRWARVTVDAASRLAPRHARALRHLVRALVGTMQFPAISLPSDLPTISTSEKDPEGGLPSGKARGRRASRQQQQLKLWGLSLGMTLDLVTAMVGPGPLALPDEEDVMGLGAAPAAVVPPSLTSVFPRFSYPDVNFWIWVFGKRYREVVRGWEESVRSGGTNDRRINWTGSALNTFYAAVRKALVIVFVARALGILFGLAFSGWWLFFSS